MTQSRKAAANTATQNTRACLECWGRYRGHQASQVKSSQSSQTRGTRRAAQSVVWQLRYSLSLREERRRVLTSGRRDPPPPLPIGDGVSPLLVDGPHQDLLGIYRCYYNIHTSTRPFCPPAQPGLSFFFPLPITRTTSPPARTRNTIYRAG